MADLPGMWAAAAYKTLADYQGDRSSSLLPQVSQREHCEYSKVCACALVPVPLSHDAISVQVFFIFLGVEPCVTLQESFTILLLGCKRESLSSGVITAYVCDVVAQARLSTTRHPYRRRISAIQKLHLARAILSCFAEHATAVSMHLAYPQIPT